MTVGIKKSLVWMGAVAVLCVGATGARAIPVFDNALQAGSQNDYVLGMDFVVNSSILVTELGVFDSDGDGFVEDVTVGIYDFSASAFVTSLTFDSGTLDGGSRFNPITPVVLAPGNYSIVAAGFDLGNASGNSGLGGTASFNDLGGALTLVDEGGRWNAGNAFVLPTDNVGGYAQSDPVFQAGTFNAERVADDGTTLLLLGAALVGIARLRRN